MPSSLASRMNRRPKPTKPLPQNASPADEDDDPIDITNSDWYWAETRRRAENGDHEASLRLIEEAAWALESDQPMNPDVHTFLGRSLAEIVNGVPATEAFMLTKPKHRSAGKNTDRDSALAAAMVLVRRKNPALSERDCAIEVIGLIGERWHLRLPDDVDQKDTTTPVTRAYDQRAGAYERYDDDLLEQLAFQMPSRRSRR